MAGTSLAQFQNEGANKSKIRNKAVLSSIMFSLGIITVFVMLGAAAFEFSKVFVQWKSTLQIFSAILIAAIGLHFLGVFKLALLNRQIQFNFGNTSNMNFLNSYIVGFAFAFGWTPCVGGVLTAIIMTASFESTALAGLKLLLVFGAGMTLPFIISAFFMEYFVDFMKKFQRHMHKVEKAMGVLLLVFAALIASDNVSIIAEWMLQYIPVS